MLIKIESQTSTRNPRRERKLWHNARSQTQTLGCSSCPERDICGGLQIREPIFDCLSFCCNQPVNCDRVCRKHPDFAARVREVLTFCLDNVPRTSAIPTIDLPLMVPMIFHGSRRDLPLSAEFIALPLAQMVNRDGSARFLAPESLRHAFRIARRSKIVLSGTDHDPPLERWWGMGHTKRRELIRNLIRLDIALTTTPNYSLFIDSPRWDDLHAMKRIAIVHHEFLSEGLPAALHVNGRTNTDFLRWTDFVASRPEITHLAYEFTTGTGWSGRQEQHVEWLCMIAASLSRPMNLVVRGGTDSLPTLSKAFAHVTMVDTSSFIKTMMRRSASVNDRLNWIPAPTAKGASVDDLLAHNIDTIQTWIGKIAS